MSYQDDFSEFEEKMITLARAVRGAQGKDTSLFVLAAVIRRLRRLLAAMEHERDWAVMDFLDGWPGTESGYNNLEDRGGIYSRPQDHDRYEQTGEMKVVPGYGPQWVEENVGLMPIVPFKDRDTNEYAYTKALSNAREIMERAYKEADDGSPAGPSYGGNQVVTEDQLLTYYHRGLEHQAEIDLQEARQRAWDEAQAKRDQEEAEKRMPKEGWSIFDWDTGEWVGSCTNQQYKEWTRAPYYQGQPGPPDEPLLVSREDPSEFIERGWRRDSRKVKQGRKWVNTLSEGYCPPDQRAVRVGQNELTP